MEWLHGWDPTPHIVSVWAEGDGLVHVWRRVDGALVHETARFRPWVLTSSIEGLPSSVTTRRARGRFRRFIRARANLHAGHPEERVPNVW